MEIRGSDIAEACVVLLTLICPTLKGKGRVDE